MCFGQLKVKEYVFWSIKGKKSVLVKKGQKKMCFGQENAKENVFWSIKGKRKCVLAKKPERNLE